MILELEITAEAAKELATYAQRGGQTPAEYARQALLAHLEDLDDIAEAEEAYQEYLDSGRRSTPLAEVMREYGLEY